MKRTLELIEKIKAGCREIEGMKPDIVIMLGRRDGLAIEALWFGSKTYGFRREYSAMEVREVVDDKWLVDEFIHKCNKQAGILAEG